MTQTIQLGSTTVEIFADSTRITLADGFTVPGVPHDTDSYRATARDHGYGADTLQLCKDHELMHIALCRWLGIDSPTMTILQHGGDAALLHRSRLEEAAVLAVQALAREAGIDLATWAGVVER